MTICASIDPVGGFCCTLEVGHAGDHVAGCGPGEEPGAIWPQSSDEVKAEVVSAEP